MTNSKTLFLPIKIAIFFSLFTLFLYEFGVWDFPTKNKFIFYLLLFIIHIMLFSGYWLGIKVKMNKSTLNLKSGKKLLDRMLNIFFIISLITFIPAFMIYTGEFNLNFASIWQKIVTGINSPSDNYMQKSVQLPSTLWGLTNYLIVLTGFVRWCLIPLGIVYWSQLKSWQRFFLPILISVELFKWLVMGTNKGIFDLFLILSISFLLSSGNLKKLKMKKEDKSRIIFTSKHKRNKFTYIIIAVLFVMVISFFTENLVGRHGGEIKYNLELAGNYMIADQENLFLRYTPEFLHSTIINLTTYLAHGYYALALSVDMPFNPTFGIGGSWFLMQNIESLSGINIFNNTYLYQIENIYGWSSTMNWHTAYLWIANDFSILGIPFVIFIYGYIFARSWKDYIYNRNPFALLIFMLFVTFFEYLSANNQVFSEYPTLFAVWFAFSMWILTKNRYYWRENQFESK